MIVIFIGYLIGVRCGKSAPKHTLPTGVTDAGKSAARHD